MSASMIGTIIIRIELRNILHIRPVGQEHYTATNAFFINEFLITYRVKSVLRYCPEFYIIRITKWTRIYLGRGDLFITIMFLHSSHLLSSFANLINFATSLLRIKGIAICTFSG